MKKLLLTVSATALLIGCDTSTPPQPIEAEECLELLDQRTPKPIVPEVLLDSNITFGNFETHSLIEKYASKWHDSFAQQHNGQVMPYAINEKMADVKRIYFLWLTKFHNQYNQNEPHEILKVQKIIDAFHGGILTLVANPLNTYESDKGVD
jgi:hypothetical protein